MWQYTSTDFVTVKPARLNGFKRTDAGIYLLEAMDGRHGQPSDAVLKKTV